MNNIFEYLADINTLMHTRQTWKN